MRFYFFILCVACYLSSTAQGWRSRFYLPDASPIYADFIYETTPNNYIAGGLGYDSNGVSCLYIMGLDANGQLLWKKQYGNSNFQYLDNIYCLASGAYKLGNNIYYACSVKDSNHTNHNIDTTGTYIFGALLKFDFNGDTLWQKIYRDSTQDVIAQRVTSSMDGGFLITGWFQNWNTHNSPVLLIKTNANGNELWRKEIHKSAPNFAIGKAIVQDSVSKKIAVVGEQYIGNYANFDCVLICDSLGNKLEQTHFMSTGGGFNDLIQTKDKQLIAVGGSISDNEIKGYITKFDINTLIRSWDITHPSMGFLSVSELQNQDLIIGGVIDTMEIHNLLSNYMVQIMKIDKEGIILNNRYYNYYLPPDIMNKRMINSLSSTSDGGLVAAIADYLGPRPFLFVKYDENGCDSSLAYCASNYTWTGVGEFAVENLQLKVYPNPANGILNVELNLTPTLSKGEGAEVEMKIINVLGELIKHSTLTAKHSEIDVSELENGIYFLQVFEKGKLVAAKKIIKE